VVQDRAGLVDRHFGFGKYQFFTILEQFRISVKRKYAYTFLHIVLETSRMILIRFGSLGYVQIFDQKLLMQVRLPKILGFWNSFEGLYFVQVREASLNVFNRYCNYLFVIKYDLVGKISHKSLL